jgi:methyltransferase family protein
VPADGKRGDVGSLTVDTSEVLNCIIRLPKHWHGSGSFNAEVLQAILKHLPSIGRSAETGTGKSTLLFSHLSQDHTVFTCDDAGNGDSLLRVQESPLLNRAHVRFVLGPTQRTLPVHSFTGLLDAVLIDGPHGYPFPELEYYFFYPHIAPDGLLIIDDVSIPTIDHLVDVIRHEEMFEMIERVQATVFFRRTNAPVRDPFGDNWWLQGYNSRRYPALRFCRMSLLDRLKAHVPQEIKKKMKRYLEPKLERLS